MGISTAVMTRPTFSPPSVAGQAEDTTAPPPRRIIKTGELAIDFGEQRMLLKGEPVEVDATELRLLELLAPLLGSPVPADYRLADDWGPDYERDLDEIKRSLWSLQSKTEDNIALRRVLWALRRRMNSARNL
jgi:DNA-binding response OmpR family regulator